VRLCVLARAFVPKAMKGWVRGALLDAQIRAKWRRDRRHLPLTGDHFELYLNIHRSYWGVLQRFPRLDPPRTRNEAIQWSKLFDQRPEHVICCDKLKVRDLIRARVGPDCVVPLYQVHDHFREIDFDALPRSIVIKPNHDSGTVLLVRDKDAFDRAEAERHMEAALARPFGWKSGEWAYSCVPPKVLVEEYLEPDAPSPPADYKYHCDGGRVLWCGYHYDRGRTTKLQQVDRDGVPIARARLDGNWTPGTDFVKPARWSEMIDVAEALAKGFRMLRVDLYCTGERILVGELTLWPSSGLSDGEAFNTPGYFGDIEFSDVQPLLHPRLRRPW
jgi:hypothetical protein